MRPHFPVMLPEVLEAVAPQAGEVVIDGTFGYGGYSEAILNEAKCQLIALDRDPNVGERAAELTAQFSGRFEWVKTPFSLMDAIREELRVDAVVLDIGVSSMQLDQAERGFSFMRSGPLDMRMSQSGPSAADAIATLSRGDLATIFKVYGEERQARRIADIIVRAREDEAIVTTDALADLIENTVGRRGKIHPATRVFQALRIFVNDELGELYRGLCAAEQILNPGGRLVVVTFHSLEDRIVKQFFRRRAERVSQGSRYAPEVKDTGPELSFELPKRSVVKPSKAEIEQNPRSRSAKLRLGVRTSHPVFARDDNILPRVPRLEDYRWVA